MGYVPHRRPQSQHSYHIAVHLSLEISRRMLIVFSQSPFLSPMLYMLYIYYIWIDYNDHDGYSKSSVQYFNLTPFIENVPSCKTTYRGFLIVMFDYQRLPINGHHGLINHY